MKEYLVSYGSVFPILSLILFVTIFVLVLLYVFTDNRVDHQHHMRNLALDDAEGNEHAS